MKSRQQIWKQIISIALYDLKLHFAMVFVPPMSENFRNLFCWFSGSSSWKLHKQSQKVRKNSKLPVFHQVVVLNDGQKELLNMIYYLYAFKFEWEWCKMRSWIIYARHHLDDREFLAATLYSWYLMFKNDKVSPLIWISACRLDT